LGKPPRHDRAGAAGADHDVVVAGFEVMAIVVLRGGDRGALLSHGVGRHERGACRDSKADEVAPVETAANQSGFEPVDALAVSKVISKAKPHDPSLRLLVRA